MLGECSESGLHRGCLWGACSSSGFCRTGREESTQATERSVCQRRYSRELCLLSPHPLGGHPGGPRCLPLPPQLRGRGTPASGAGEICFASGVQAAARGGEGCRGVLRPPLTCEECRESPGRHPHAAGPSPCLRAAGNRRLRARHLELWGAQCPGHPVTPRYTPQRSPGRRQCPPSG